MTAQETFFFNKKSNTIMKLFRPICGGQFDPNAESTSDGKIKLTNELNTERQLLHEGVQELGPWDCSGELEILRT